MATRLDIDALLIGALYGELDGDDRARLDAHLATHPADRAALDELRATRAFLTEHGARDYLGAAEPPAAVSALVMREAARRAPAPRKAAGGVFGFLTGLLRPVAAHPALSMAAVAVIAIGVGSMMSKDGRVQVAQPSAPAVNAAAPVAPTPVPEAVAPAPDLPPTEGVAVTLDEGGADRPAEGDGAARDRADNLEKRKSGAVTRSKPSPSAKAPPREQAFLSVDKKDLGGDVALRDLDEREESEAPVAGAARSGPTGKVSVAPAAAAPPPVATPAPDDAVAGLPRPTTTDAIASWARDQHARMVRLVNDGRCTEAGQIGAEIARKAPDYYQAAVANDRALRSCKAYVDRARRAQSPAPKAKNEAANLDSEQSAK